MGCLMSRLCCSCSPSSEKLPAQCMDDPMALKAMIIVVDQEFPMPKLIQVEDNQECYNGEEFIY